ncbi:alpha/beta hydrolase [Blastopirellula marina]|nr:alpha/beta hydrolase [Blastopirellula marina]
MYDFLLFYPSKFPTGDWKPNNLRFQDVFFTAKDGTKLHGWYCPADNPRAVMLVAHGNAGHVAARAEWIRFLQTELSVSVFMFDYRGYGRSEGKPTIRGVLQDGTAARAKLCELASIEPSEMLIMGESLGGAIAVQLAADAAPRGLILQSTFSSLRDVADVHFPKLSWLVSRKVLDSVTQIKRYRGPLLQSHGSLDLTIPYASGEKLFRAANEPKQFVTVEGAYHNDCLTDAYLKQLDAFITRVSPADE